MNERNRMSGINWIAAFRLWFSKLQGASELKNLSRAVVLSLLIGVLGVLAGHGFIGFALLTGIAFHECKKVKETWLVCENRRGNGPCEFLVDRREEYCGGCGTKIPPMLRLAKNPPKIWPPGLDTNP